MGMSQISSIRVLGDDMVDGQGEGLGEGQRVGLGEGLEAESCELDEVDPAALATPLPPSPLSLRGQQLVYTLSGERHRKVGVALKEGDSSSRSDGDNQAEVKVVEAEVVPPGDGETVELSVMDTATRDTVSRDTGTVDTVSRDTVLREMATSAVVPAMRSPATLVSVAIATEPSSQVTNKVRSSLL